jgi:hypothetical protein
MHRHLGLLLVVSATLACRPEMEEGGIWTLIPIDVEVEGGVNLLDSPSKLRDNELRKAQNLVPGEDGMLRKRPALGFVSISGYGSSYVPIAFQGPVGNSGSFVALLWQKDLEFLDLVVLDGAGGSEASNIISPITTTPKATIFNFGLAQYIFSNTPGAEFRKKLVETTITDFVFAGTGNETLYPAVASRYRSRVAFGNFGAGYERYIVMTDNNTIDVVGDSALTSRGFFVGDDGDKIVAIHEIATTGDKLRPSLLVLLEHSAFVITGQPNQTTDSSSFFGDMEIARLPYNSGCASANTVAVTPYGTIWAGPDNVWMFRVGQGIIPVGAKIRPALESTPAVLRYRWVGAYFDGFYRLAVFSPGQGPDEIAQLGEQWWLDLEDDSKVPSGDTAAAWYGPQVFNLITDDVYEPSPDLGVPDPIVGTLMFAQDTRPGSAPNLYGLDRGWATGGVLFISSYGTQSGDRDISYDSSININEVIGTEILMDLQTKKYGLDKKNAPLLKVFRKGEVVGMPMQESRITFEGTVGPYVDTIHKYVNPFGFTTDVDQLDEETLAEKIQTFAFWPDPATRKSGADVSFRVYDTAGIVVSEGYNDEFALQELGSPAEVVRLTPGLYTDVKAFLDHLVTMMGGYSHNLTGSAPYAPLIAITNDVATDWQPWFIGPVSGVTDVQLRKTRAIAQMLGYDTSVDPALAPTQTAGAFVPAKRAAIWELHGISGLVQMTGKRGQ